MTAPSRHDPVGFPRRLEDKPVVLRADGIIHLLQLLRTGRAEREQVDDMDTAVAEGPREAHAPADGGVVPAVVRGARVEHDPAERFFPAVPYAGQPVAIPA